MGSWLRGRATHAKDNANARLICTTGFQRQYPYSSNSSKHDFDLIGRHGTSGKCIELASVIKDGICV